MPKGREKDKRVYGARKESTIFFMNAREARDLIRALKHTIRTVPEVRDRLGGLIARIEKAFDPIPR